MDTANVMVMGSGGREHALAWKLSQSPHVGTIYRVPGNPGEVDRGVNVPIGCASEADFPAIRDLVRERSIDLVVVGPEAPLVEGIVDYLGSQGITRVIGPGQQAAKLESDKVFSFRLMDDCGIPQAYTTLHESAQDAVRGLDAFDAGVVVKFPYLDAGKGVKVCSDAAEARAWLEGGFNRRYPGEPVMLAERLFGQELSVFSLSDGKNVVTYMMAFQDHKPLLDGDRGPNTGGMGAYGPAPLATEKDLREIHQGIVRPVIAAMARQGAPYKGFLYTGLMKTADGFKVLEFNARLGDPETQPFMMLHAGDLYEELSVAAEGRAGMVKPGFRHGAAVCVVLAAEGYAQEPGPRKGIPLENVSLADEIDGFKVFHAGTELRDGRLVSSGGRVLGVTAYHQGGIREAQLRAYAGVGLIARQGGDLIYRTDIGAKALEAR